MSTYTKLKVTLETSDKSKTRYNDHMLVTYFFAVVFLGLADVFGRSNESEVLAEWDESENTSL